MSPPPQPTAWPPPPLPPPTPPPPTPTSSAPSRPSPTCPRGFHKAPFLAEGNWTSAGACGSNRTGQDARPLARPPSRPAHLSRPGHRPFQAGRRPVRTKELRRRPDQLHRPCPALRRRPGSEDQPGRTRALPGGSRRVGRRRPCRRQQRAVQDTGLVPKGLSRRTGRAARRPGHQPRRQSGRRPRHLRPLRPTRPGVPTPAPGGPGGGADLRAGRQVARSHPGTHRLAGALHQLRRAAPSRILAGPGPLSGGQRNQCLHALCQFCRPLSDQ